MMGINELGPNIFCRTLQSMSLRKSVTITFLLIIKRPDDEEEFWELDVISCSEKVRQNSTANHLVPVCVLHPLSSFRLSLSYLYFVTSFLH
jgi:hypothetical protein